MNPTPAEIAACLARGGVVLLPTDTVYGLAVSPEVPEAAGRLFALKGRPRSVNLPIMVASADDLVPLGIDLNAPARTLLASPFVPGALTLVMGFVDAPLVPWLAGREEVAIRIPDHPLMLDVLRAAGPLLVTSANAHGQPTPETVPEILAQLHGAPDLAVDGGLLRTVPSTLVNCRPDPPVVEREGIIPAAELSALLGNLQ